MAIDMGISALHPLQPNCNDIYGIKRRYGSQLCLMGNMDLAGVLTRGTPEQVREQVRRNMEIFKPGGGYVFNGIHNIQADVPPENIVALFEAAYEYG